MFSKFGTTIGTKIALRKAGLGDISLPSFPSSIGSSKQKSRNADASDGSSSPFANLNLTLPKSWASWQTPEPPPIPISPEPVIGARAPSSERLQLPSRDGRPTVVLFLRHCGDPFTPSAFLTLRHLSTTHPSIHFIAISHSSPSATSSWLNALGGAWSVTVLIDEDRELYARWGLGVSNTWHLLNPWTQVNRYKLENGAGGRRGMGMGVGEEGRGNVWQMGGCWAVDARGMVRWGGRARSADQVYGMEEGVRAVGG